MLLLFFVPFVKYLEFRTRYLAEKKGYDIQVWTGPWGILQLDDVNNNPVDIFLGLYQGKAVIPAPLITWKVIIHIIPISKFIK